MPKNLLVCAEGTTIEHATGWGFLVHILMLNSANIPFVAYEGQYGWRNGEEWLADIKEWRHGGYTIPEIGELFTPGTMRAPFRALSAE